MICAKCLWELVMRKIFTFAVSALLVGTSAVYAQDKEPLVVTGADTAKLSDWIEAKTEHFTIYGNVSSDEMRKYATRVERFDAAMRALVPAKQTSKVTIYLVDRSKVQELAGSEYVAGFYSGSAQGPLIVTTTGSIRYNNDIKITAARVMYHEYTHHMLLSNQDVVYPGWLTEGMAEFFSTVINNDDGSMTFGANPEDRQYSIASNNRFSVKQLLESDGKQLDPEDNIQRYSRGWLLYHYITLGKKRPPNQLSTFISAINDKGMKPLEAGELAFGNLNKLDGELESYMRQSTFPSALIKPDQFLKGEIQVEMRNLRASEAEIMPMRLRSAAGVTKITAPKVLARAQPIAAKYPGDPFVQRSYAEMAYDAENLTEANLAADRSLAIDPNNLMAMVYKGRAAAKKAYGDKNPEGWKEARKWFLKANKTDADNPLPFILYYDTFVAEGKPVPDAAVTGMLRAAVLAPQDQTVNIRVGYALINQGDLKSARTVLAPVAFSPHLKPDNPSAKVLRLIDTGAAKEAVLEEAKKAKIDKVNDFIPPEDEKKKEDGKASSN
jgi:tetratricopeptide (TPR) repeat protein